MSYRLLWYHNTIWYVIFEIVLKEGSSAAFKASVTYGYIVTVAMHNILKWFWLVPQNNKWAKNRTIVFDHSLDRSLQQNRREIYFIGCHFARLIPSLGARPIYMEHSLIAELNTLRCEDGVIHILILCWAQPGSGLMFLAGPMQWPTFLTWAISVSVLFPCQFTFGFSWYSNVWI